MVRMVEKLKISLVKMLTHIFFSADGLKEVFVNSYDEISKRMDEGTVNR